MEYLKLLFNWIKVNFAKEALLTTLSLVLAAFLSWIAHLVLIEKKMPELDNLYPEYNIDYLERRIVLFVILLAMIYGIRFVERMINIVLIPKEEIKE